MLTNCLSAAECCLSDRLPATSASAYRKPPIIFQTATSSRLYSQIKPSPTFPVSVHISDTSLLYIYPSNSPSTSVPATPHPVLSAPKNQCAQTHQFVPSDSDIRVPRLDRLFFFAIFSFKTPTTPTTTPLQHGRLNHVQLAFVAGLLLQVVHHAPVQRLGFPAFQARIPIQRGLRTSRLRLRQVQPQVGFRHVSHPLVVTQWFR